MPKHLLSDFFKVLYIFIKIQLRWAPAKLAANHKNPGIFLSSFHFFAFGVNYRLKCKKEHQTSAKSPNRLPVTVTAPTLDKHLQMVNTEPFQPKRAHMSASWTHKRPYGSVWAHMGPAWAHNVRETVLEIKIFGGKRLY